MTRLLVSVRSAAEARIALDAGADLIDVKEPAGGSLGAADRTVVDEVLREVAGRAPASMALGELRDWRPRAIACPPRGIAYAKLGMAAMAPREDWPHRWAAALGELPQETRGVAVVYADWRTCGAPSPPRVLDRAARLGLTALLIDTHEKSAGGLPDHWPRQELATFAAEVRRQGMLLVLAGSLVAQTIPLALELTPDYIAVRGAACTAGRSGPIDPERVRCLARLVRGSNVSKIA